MLCELIPRLLTLCTKTAAFESYILQWAMSESTKTFSVSTQPEQLFKSLNKFENLLYDLLLFSVVSWCRARHRP